MSRVVIFGLDAASPELIQRWAADLPTLRRLMEEGTWGTLQSTIPPFTSPAWSCMVTGKNPAKVGIFGLRQRQEGSYSFLPPTSADRRAPAVWDIASQAGRRVIVLNTPDTYPPSPVNGVMVSGRPAPVDAGAPITYPSELRAHLDRVVGGYLVAPSADFDDASRGEEIETWIEVLERQQQALEYLMDTQSWDLLFYVSMAIDGISHHFWKHLDPQHPDHDSTEAQRFGDVIRRIYKLEDRRLGHVLQRLAGEDFLLVVSDHGSTSCYRHIAVNRWLLEHGYLVLQEEFPTVGRSVLGPLSPLAVRLYRRFAWVRQMARPLRRTALRDVVVEAHFARKTGGRTSLDALAIDWERTTAYYLGDDRLYLNVAGREPLGIVQPGAEYLRCRDQLRDELTAACDPETGRPLFAAVYACEEIYTGPYLEQAPDLVLVPGDSHWNLGGAVGDLIVDRPVVSGKHHPAGVFIAWGGEIRPGQRRTASIYDIAPTVLHAMSLPIPEDCDGTVRIDWFAPESATGQRAIATAHVDDVRSDEYHWTPEEKAQIEARLRGLGYLD